MSAVPDSLKAAAGRLLDQAGHYGDLVGADLAVATRSASRRLWTGVALVLALVLALQLACVLVISVTWATPDRGLAIGSLLGFFAVVAAGAGASLIALRRRRQPLLSSTAAAWQKDRALLAARLAPDGAAATDGVADTFPRSQTLRWLLAKPLRGWLGSALLTGALSRLPVGRTLAGWVLGRKR